MNFTGVRSRIDGADSGASGAGGASQGDWAVTGAPMVFRAGIWQRWSLACLAVLFSVLAVAMGVFAGQVVLEQPLAGVVLLTCAALQTALAVHAWREARLRWFMRADLSAARAVLHLPAARAHRPGLGAYHGSLAYSDITAVESRVEVHRWLAWPVVHSAWRLRLRDGSLVILGEDRSLGRRVPMDATGRLATLLAERAGIVVAHRGRVPGLRGYVRS